MFSSVLTETQLHKSIHVDCCYLNCNDLVNYNYMNTNYHDMKLMLIELYVHYFDTVVLGY